jgi:predicted ferric reductase
MGRVSMTGERLRRILWLGAAVLCPAIPLQAYFAGNWYSILHSYSLGMFCGILSYVYFANTLILATRIRCFDRLFGHDRVMVFHGRLAGVAFVFAGAHAVFKYLYFGPGTVQINIGIAALAIFAAVGLATVLFMLGNPLHQITAMAALRTFGVRRLGFDYSRLKLFHNLTAPALALVTAHVLMASPTAETRSRLWLMGAWGAAALLGHFYHKVLRVALRYRRAFRVTAVRRLADSVVEIRAARPDGSKLEHRAGQFAFFRLLSPVCGLEEHPFTISSPPGSETLSITVKALGDYSAALSAVAAGTKLLCDGPYGRFTPERGAGPCLFVAGGIGITPFLSSLREWDVAGITEPVTLIWSMRTRDEQIDEGFFETVATRHAAFRFVPVLTREPGETGRRVDRALLSAYIEPANAARLAAYVCGPDPFRRAVMGHLRDLGLPRRAVHAETFSF